MKKIKRSFKQILISGLSMACGLSLALGVGNFFFQSYFTKANAETTVDAIVSPRYIYDTSISDGVLGVGSTLALPKATIQNSLNGNDVASAAVTILYNGTVVEGYNETELYSNDFTFANAGNYDIIYSYAHSSETPKDYYRLNVTQDAPVIKATERTPYTVATNTEIKLPQLEMTFNGAAVDYVVNLYYPDETAYRFKDTVLEQDGLYKIEFKTEINQTVYTYVKSIYAYGTNVDFTGKQTPYYGTSSFEKTMETMKSYTDKDGADKLVWTDGLNVAFEKGDVFTYQKPINLKELGSMDKLIKFYVEPTGATEIYFYVDLVDVNDANNVLSVRFSSVPEATGSRSYRTWVSAAATGIGQEFVGRRYMDGGANDILYVDRHAGAYTCVDVSGLVNTELYYPLSFAYDEDAKQVYTGLVDRASTLIVSDLDDTETYFEKAWTATSQIVGGRTGYYTKAWDGFSSDEVYLRMRVEGNYSTPIQTLITKIGNHELKPKFESLLPETIIEYKSNGYYTFNGNSAPYYDAPSFEETLKTLDSYYKATDKLTWTDGINVTFDKSDVFNYGELIDLSELGTTAKLFTILIKPTGAATTLLYVDLIDENDPENILSVRFVCTKTSDTDYRTLVTASALKTGLPYTGYWAANNALHLDRNNGGFYTSVDISGLNTALYYPLSFAYDETTKQVLSCIADRSQLGIVADMDDTTTEFSNVWYGSTQLKNPNDATKYCGYVQKAWGGFSSNKVYLRVRTDGSYEQPLETCITRIGAENLAITGKAKPFFVDNDTIEIDVGGYDYNNLPNAIVGSPYNLFESVGYDITGKELPITKKIYYGNTDVQIAHNGVSFIPPKAGKYTIVYSATDRYGYVTTKEYVVIAVTEISDDLKPVIETETNEVNAITGWTIKLPAYEARNGIGGLSVNIQILHNGKVLKEFLQNEELVFTPIANGEYVVNYVVRDYIGNTSTACVTIFAEANSEPVFQGDVELPSVMVAGWSYKLPDLYAMDYYADEPQLIKAKITAYDNRGEFIVENGEYSPRVNESKLVKIVYSVQTENGYAEKEYTVQVQKTSDGNGLNVSEYFIGENVDIASTKTAVRVKAKQTGASFRFINPILIGKNGLTLVFNIPTTANNFNSLTIYLTDVENEKNAIKYTLYKGDSNNKEDMSFTTLLINNEDTAYRVPGSFLSGAGYELTYEELYRRITATTGANAPVNKTIYGEEFEGFAGRFVYVTFEFGGKVDGDACLDITKINNQALNSTITNDTMAPQIAVLGEYGGMAEINTETTIMRAVAGDILAENVTVTVTVTDPKGLKNIISIDGVALKGADASKEYCFIPTQYGAYRVTFTAEDCNGKSATMSYNITVVDNKGPTISLDGEIPAEIILEDGKAVLRIPNITVTDESGKECRVVINLKRPDGTMVRLEETEVLISASGKYVLYIDAYDSSNNLTIKTFVIIVR